MGRYLAVFAAALGVVAGAASADDRPAVVVTDPSARTFRAAVQYFADLGAERARAPVDSLRGHIVSGLEFSNLFEAIDPKLTVFALANGMDLAKDEGSRRLSWFTEGLERGLRIERGTGDSYVVTATAWRINAPDDVTSSPVSDDVPVGDLTTKLEADIDAANALQP